MRYELAQVYKLMKEFEDAVFQLKKALEHKNSLNIPQGKIMKEIEELKNLQI
ncbi:MAG: hypothetical protein MZU97_01800 [Bacillus subtilis]|nr:hypothetical protein [Bacillus subtilis]